MSAALTPAVVDFHGDQLLTVQIGGTPYVPMKPIITSFGLDWSRQARRMKHGGRYGHRYLTLQTNGGAQEMLCLPLRKVNGWLFSVNANRVRDDVRPKLIRYQEECFEVLYRYWNGDLGVSAGLVGRTFSPDLQNRVWYNGAPVLASSSLAVFYGTDAKTLSNMKRDTRGLFLQGVHFYDIKGDDVKRFYREAEAVAVAILPPVPPVHGLTLFTDEGARYLALSLGRAAQDAYLHLRRTYYAPEPDTWATPTGCLDVALARAEQLLATVHRAADQIAGVAGHLTA